MIEEVQRLGRLVVSVVIVSMISACGATAPEGASSRGVVEAVDATARTVTLDHEELPGLMGAMTMQFDVAPDVDLESLVPGTEVEFTVEEDAGRYVVTAVRRGGS